MKSKGKLIAMSIILCSLIVLTSLLVYTSKGDFTKPQTEDRNNIASTENQTTKKEGGALQEDMTQKEEGDNEKKDNPLNTRYKHILTQHNALSTSVVLADERVYYCGYGADFSTPKLYGVRYDGSENTVLFDLSSLPTYDSSSQITQTSYVNTDDAIAYRLKCVKLEDLSTHQVIDKEPVFLMIDLNTGTVSQGGAMYHTGNTYYYGNLDKMSKANEETLLHVKSLFQSDTYDIRDAIQVEDFIYYIRIAEGEGIYRCKIDGSDNTYLLGLSSLPAYTLSSSGIYSYEEEGDIFYIIQPLGQVDEKHNLVERFECITYQLDLETMQMVVANGQEEGTIKTLIEGESKYYDTLWQYLYQETVKVFSPYYELLDIKMTQYEERVLEDGTIGAIFLYTIVDKNYNRDPDTVGYIKEAKEKDDPYYEVYYEEYLLPKEGNMVLKALISKEGIIELYTDISPHGESDWVPFSLKDCIVGP